MASLHPSMQNGMKQHPRSHLPNTRIISNLRGICVCVHACVVVHAWLCMRACMCVHSCLFPCFATICTTSILNKMFITNLKPGHIRGWQSTPDGNIPETEKTKLAWAHLEKIRWKWLCRGREEAGCQDEDGSTTPGKT